jgi:hypothetical protein
MTMDNVQEKVYHFNNTPSSKSFRFKKLKKFIIVEPSGSVHYKSIEIYQFNFRRKRALTL